jgi:hypothetical protein
VGQLGEARHLLEQACQLRRELGDEVGLAYSQQNLSQFPTPTGKGTKAAIAGKLLPWLIGGVVTVALVSVAASSGIFRPSPPPAPTATIEIPSATAVAAEPVAEATAPLVPTVTPSPTTTSTPAETLTPSPSETPSPVPTYAILNATVITETSYCFYGPGRFYLSLTGLILDNPVQVTGRARDLNWVYINFTGVNPGDITRCWVLADELKMSGEFSSLEVVYPNGSYRLPGSRFPPVVNVEAERLGDTVIVTWESAIDDLPLGERESATAERYLVEAWLCRDGVVTFTPRPVYPYKGYIELLDEAGCSEPSHARVLLAEKHGYATPVEVDWPPHP